MELDIHSVSKILLFCHPALQSSRPLFRVPVEQIQTSPGHWCW